MPKRKKAVGKYLVCRKKLNKLKKLAKWKIDIITRSFSQVFREDFNETFTFVLKFMTLYIILVIAVFHNFELHQVDIFAAFLNENLEKEIFMKVSNSIKKFMMSRISKRLWKLNKSLYGFKQLPRQ